MQRAIRMLILVVGLACTCLAASAPMATSFDGGPLCSFHSCGK
jgi:hypothetical protein